MKVRPHLIPVIVMTMFLISSASLARAENWETDLNTLLDQEDPDYELVKQILARKPAYDELVAAIGQHRPLKTFKGPEFLEFDYLCSDGVGRPFVVYVPSQYSPDAACPVLVYLHGGVGRKEISPDYLDYARKDDFIPFAERKTWLVLFPFGQAGATWWDEVQGGQMLHLCAS